MVLLSTDGPLATAQGLAALGFNVLPARYKDKTPIVPWTKHQHTRTDKLLPTWFGGSGNRNFWLMTGRMSRCIVIDCDTEAGDKWWRERIGDDMDATTQVSTRKGTHYYFKIPDDWDMKEPIPGWAVHPQEEDDFEESWDVRADGGGVIAPPSVHESGHRYTWVLPDGADDPVAGMVLAPAGLMDGTYRKEAPAGNGGGSKETKTGTDGQTRSMLSSLLSNPPSGEGSGRNDWLARVAGHYAKTYHNVQDLYDTHCQQANDSMGKPLSKAEFKKTVRSIWDGEHERHPSRTVDADCGWLVDGGFVIMTQVALKGKDDTKTMDLAPYTNFNIKAKGVMVDDEGKRTYWVELIIKRVGGKVDTIDAVLPAVVSGDDKSLRLWLSKYGVNVLPPDNMWPKSGSPNLRIQRYLESQQPPIVQINAALGWDSAILGGAGGFVTHEGVITATDVIPMDQSGVRANPTLLSGGIAPHAYGFDNDGDEAKRVLREVLTFHEDEITSIFGAWWAACLVKPQIEEYSSLFPFVAIEAPSESGKTNGFFDMMTQLNGNTRGESQSTKAALRDMAAAHKNGIVWIDDMDDPANLMELLRAATSGGTITKMGEDRESVKNAKIVSPIVISGEQLGINTQKALIDRAVTINATSPTHRRSLRDESQPQWNDVLQLREEYPNGLSSLAGWLVQNALSQTQNVLEALRDGRRGVAGRAADKVAILRAGARLLDWLVEEDEEQFDWAVGAHHSGVVEAWIDGAPSSEFSHYDNALTLKVLPWALRHYDYIDKPAMRKHHTEVHTPVFVREPNGLALQVAKLLNEPTDSDGGPEIWFSVPLLAEAWRKAHNGMVDKRTESEGALKQQADAVRGMGPGKQWKIVGAGGVRSFYRVIRGDMVRELIARAEGQQ